MLRKILPRISFYPRAAFFDDPPVVPPVAPPTSPPPPPPAPPPIKPEFELPAGMVGRTSFTQADVNHIVAEQKRKAKGDATDLATRLEELQKQANLTQQQRDELQGEIDKLAASTQTKEEQHKLEIEKKDKKSKETQEKLTGERDTWKGRFEQEIITNDILASSAEYKAFNPSQIAAIVAPLTKAEEEVRDGKPTGRFITRVNFTGKDKDGKPIPLVLSVKEAVKTMTEMPELYGNLFRSDANGGLGGNPAPGKQNGDVLKDIDTMPLAEYQKNRVQILTALGKK